MQKKILGAIAVLFTFTTTVHAEMSFGICNYAKQTVDSINCAGAASLQETSVTGDMHIAGPLKSFKSTIGAMDIAGVAEMHNSIVKGKATIAGMLNADQSTFKDIRVAGAATFNKSTIKGNAEIAGSLSAVNSRFEKNVSVDSKKMQLKSSEVKGDVLVKSKQKKPEVILTCGSHIGGSITFNDNAGVVKIANGSNVIGKINNGTMEVVKKSCD
jgi:hypothetical protein